MVCHTFEYNSGGDALPPGDHSKKKELAQGALDQECAFADWEVEDYAEASQAPITSYGDGE